jgi:hypothetical protein
MTLLVVLASSLLASAASTFGVPRASDVTMRSLSWHQGGEHDTFEAAAAFNVSRIDWIYTADAAFFAEAHKRGIYVSAAMNGEVPDPATRGGEGAGASTWNIGRQIDMHGNQIHLPWMTW